MGSLVQTGLRKNIKKLFPKKLFRYVIQPPYHFLRAVLANIYYRFPARGMTVIGVTGTNGKSTSVALLKSIFEADGRTVGSFSTLEFTVAGAKEKNRIGTTSSNVFTIQKFYRQLRDKGVDLVIQEATSHGLQQRRLLGVPIEGALITNLTPEHLDYHGTMEKYAKAKGLLFKKPSVKYSVINADDEWFDYFNQFEPEVRKLAYGQSEQANARIEDLKSDINGSSFTLNIEGHKLQLKTQLIGIGNVQNVADAACMAHLYGVSDEIIQQGISNVTHMIGRLMRVDEGQDFAVFSDVSHTPDGLQLIFDILRELTEGRIILLQSTMDGREPKKRIKLGKVGGENADVVFVCDDEAYELPREVMRGWIKQGIAQAEHQPDKVVEIEDRQHAITAAMEEAQPGDTVLVIPFGHHDTMTFYDETKPWDEVAAIRKSLRYVLGKRKTPPKKSWNHDD